VVWCGIVVTCVVCLVHCGYFFFLLPLAKIIHKKRRKQKEGQKNFCKEIEEKFIINSEVACH
jgi:hypothetical protein